MFAIQTVCDAPPLIGSDAIEAEIGEVGPFININLDGKIL